MKIPNPIEFRQLAWVKKVFSLTWLYFMKCSYNQAYINGKYTSNFWLVRRHFTSKQDRDLHTLYDFLYGIEHKKEMSLSEMYVEAEAYRIKQNFDLGADKKADTDKGNDYLKLVSEL